MIFVYIASGCAIALALFLVVCAVSCCMLSSKISQAEEKEEFRKNSKNSDNNTV